jgi:cellobiose phosphorylase
VFVLADAPAKVTRVRVTNRGATARTLSLWSYQQLVLGVTPAESGASVVTERDGATGALFARNPLAGEYAGRVAFASAMPSVAPLSRSETGDRASFLGDGGVAKPLAPVTGRALDGRVGAGLDACFASQLVFALRPGESVECAFVLGEGADEAEARAVLARLERPGAVAEALESATARWRELVSGVQVRTPEPAIDLMVNGWLAYQTLSCRIWGRTAFYQSGGAFGFRDQLQDAASLLHLAPSLAREQILLHAGHQFAEGDVLHWWHPPLSKGMRTHFADDLLWLPLLTAYYVSATGDVSVLDERARFLEAPPLAPGEDEVYLVPRDSGQSADVYEHCCRAIDRSLVRGAHGLPLFGTGDWNDGMNRVGREGRGESVWMGFFLHAILGDFAPLCERRGDHVRAERYERFRDQLRVALNDGGWDGEWYRRAYYDNGEPMGSTSSDECRIDGLAQAWAVLSGAAPPERAVAAMEAARRELVDERAGLIRLLTPAFRDTPNDPGYIKGYVAGVRENGGQYTHAALWVVRAFAELGRHDLAAPLLAMLSPVSHTTDPARLERYRTEPYVIVADVYGEPPHVGRGGWTWYTGSAGWMLRVAIENVFGIRLVGGDRLFVKPCTPASWPEYHVRYRVPGGAATYELTVRCPSGHPGAVVSATVDGRPATLESGGAWIPIDPAPGSHEVRIELG